MLFRVVLYKNYGLGGKYGRYKNKSSTFRKKGKKNMGELMNLHFTNIWWVFLLPLILMVLDVITGYYNAWEKNKVSSSRMRDGLGKKCAELCYVVLGTLFNFAFGISAVMYFMVIYVCYMEIVSLFENCAKLGLPIPNQIKEKLNNEEEKDNERKKE